MTTNFEGKKFTFVTDAIVEYRSNIGDFTCINPNNWMSAIVADNTGKQFKAWFKIKNPDAEMDDFDFCDYNNITDIDNIDG